MKKSILLLLASGLLSQLAYSEVFWAPGVSQEPGTWYDVNKAWTSDEKTGKGDDVMCWAAASSNIIAWWQDRNKENLTGLQGVPSGANQVWQAYQDAFYNTGFDGGAGLEWFVLGDEYLNEVYGEGVAPRDPNYDMPGGYYKDVLVDPESLFTYGSMADYYEDAPIVKSYISLEEFSSQLVSTIRGGSAVTLGLTGDDYFGGHAITLWGVDYNDATGLIETMYITDSDDAHYGKEGGLITVRCEAKEFDVSSVEGGDEKVKFFVMFDDKPEEKTWYHGGEHITSFAALNGTATFYHGVPEPTTGTLGLLALASLCARRRKK